MGPIHKFSVVSEIYFANLSENSFPVILLYASPYHILAHILGRDIGGKAIVLLICSLVGVAIRIMWD